MIEKLGGRKMFLALLSVLLGCAIFAITGSISTELVTLLLGTIGAFNLGNVAVTRAGLAADGKPVEAQPAVPEAITSAEMQNISVQLDTLQATATEIAQATALNQQGVAAILQIAQGRPRAG
jgi:hypothetical protein